MRVIDDISTPSGAMMNGRDSLAQVTIDGVDYLLKEIKFYNKASSYLALKLFPDKYEKVSYLGFKWLMWEGSLRDIVKEEADV